MYARLPWPRAAALAAVAAALLRCGPYHVDREVHAGELGGLRSPPTVALTPPRLLIDHAPFQVYELAADVADVLAEEGGLAVVAPWDYDPEGELVDCEDPERALMAMAERGRLPQQDVLVADLIVEEHAVARDMRAPLAMGGQIEREYESQVRVRLEVRTFPRGEPVAEVAVDFEDPPFHDEATPANPRPVLREGVRRAARQLADLLGDAGLAPALGRPPEARVTVNPRLLFGYRGSEGSLASQLAPLDELDRLAQSLVYYQYFEPELDGASLRLLEASDRPGVLVDVVGDDAAQAGLQAGDYIVALDGQPVTGLHAYLRAFASRPPGAQVAAEVLRDGQTVTLSLPVLSR